MTAFPRDVLGPVGSTGTVVLGTSNLTLVPVSVLPLCSTWLMLPILGGKYKHSLWEWVCKAPVIINTWNHTGVALLLLVKP